VEIQGRSSEPFMRNNEISMIISIFLRTLSFSKYLINVLRLLWSAIDLETVSSKLRSAITSYFVWKIAIFELSILGDRLYNLAMFILSNDDWLWIMADQIFQAGLFLEIRTAA
jgi:hypothetical protein